MPPFTPKSTANQREQTAAAANEGNSAINEPATEFTPNLTELNESGPAARQRVFVEERLAGAATSGAAPNTAAQTMAQTTTRSVEEADSVEDSAGPVSSPASVQPASAQPRSLAAERQASLAAFRSRQLAQTALPTALDQRPGALATASRSLEQTGLEATMPAFIETNRWLLLGPSVVREGQSGKQSAMSGRVRDIAVAPGGERLYIATANGGVWRSEDGGRSWLSLMDAFDLNPTYYRADSLACGALALVPGNWAGEDILYVGSGEPGIAPWFQGDSAYFGVGPIVSTDGGLTWVTEPSKPTLAGSAFYELAVDPTWPARVVGATLLGLYRRELDANGSAQWVKKQDGYFCSVVVSHRNDFTVFYAAEWGGRVWQSGDGETWTPLGNELPEGEVGRIGLAVQADNPDIVYALVANIQDHLLGVFRLDRAEEEWRRIEDVPATLFGPDLTRAGQGGYDLAIAVDPADVNRIYVGGSIVHSDGIRLSDSTGDWSGALYRCEIEIHPTSQQLQALPTYIGGAIHGDLHALRHAPGDADRLWVGCDGGIFFSAAPTADPTDEVHATGLFFPCNTGLSTMTMNYLGMHPTEEAVLFCGTQDNGGLRYTGDPVWLYSSGGDSGYFVINWDNPYEVVTTYVQNQIFRSMDGGLRYSYDAIHVLPASGEAVQFYAPLAGTPYRPAQPETATRIAFGGKRVWLSDHLGGDGVWWNGQRWMGEVDWVSLPDNRYESDAVDGLVETLRFASATKLYAGTTTGRVYRYDLIGDAWQRSRLPAIANDLVAAYVGTITSIAIDETDSSGNAIYVTLGGFTNPQRVWHFDGVQWEPRSGPQQKDREGDETGTVDMGDMGAGTTASDALLDIQHNAIVVDPQQPSHLYVAADIGIWRSIDGGRQWQVFARGLPDAAVIDLQLHESSRLLRAATHGRGVYEFDLGRPQRAVDLYIRDHILDLGRHPTATGLPDPTRFGATVEPGQSPDIKIDVPDEAGRYQLAGVDPRYQTPFPPSRAPESTVDFYTFATKLPADSNTLATHSRSNIQTMIYVQVHNRGRNTANNVRVMLLLATNGDERSSGSAPPSQTHSLPPLPRGYETAIRAGEPIASAQWQTIGLATVHGVRPGHPQVASFTLDANRLPTPGRLRKDAHYTLVAIVHSADDPFTATDTAHADTAPLAPANNRHVAHRSVQVVPFGGQIPKDTVRRRPLSPGTEHFIAEHHVRPGETLSQIAKHYYRSAQQWPLIYRANESLIGPDPDLLRSGLRLKIPRP